ncbi:hypothetical protein ACU4I5_18570 [Ensifer adhaerens]
MPRTGGVYSPPAGTKGVSNTTIQSVPYNAFVDDLTDDANAPRPITAGGTGATTASGARTALGLGTAATKDTGTSGATVPLLNGNNTHSGNNVFSGDVSITRSTPLVYLNANTNQNSEVWFRENSINRGLLMYEQATDRLALRVFNTSGVETATLAIPESGILSWTGSVRYVDRTAAAGDINDVFAPDSNTFFKWNYTQADAVSLQRANNFNFTGATTLLGFDSSSNATFAGRVTAPQIFSTSDGLGTNYKVGNDAWIGDINVANTIGIKGELDPAAAYIQFAANAVAKLGVSAAMPAALAWGTSGLFIQTDGNMYLPMYSDYLGNVINNKAGFSTSTNVNETTFPVGQVLVAAGSLNRRSTSGVWLSSGDARLYSTTVSGAQLPGTWVSCGLASSGNTQMQKIG